MEMLVLRPRHKFPPKCLIFPPKCLIVYFLTFVLVCFHTFILVCKMRWGWNHRQQGWIFCCWYDIYLYLCGVRHRCGWHAVHGNGVALSSVQPLLFFMVSVPQQEHQRKRPIQAAKTCGAVHSPAWCSAPFSGAGNQRKQAALVQYLNRLLSAY